MESLYLNDIVKDHPAEKAAFIFKDQVTTYGQFRQNVEAKAVFLQSRGIREGDRVGLISKNCPQFVETYFACALAGAIVVPINFQLVTAEIAYICQDTGMKVLIAQKKIDLAEALAELGVEQSPEQFAFEEMVPPAEMSFRAVDRKPEEAVAIIYTSGTTGRPKGAVLSQSGIVANTIGISKRVNMHEEDISLCVLPMYHCFAWVTSVCGNLYFGATIVVQETFHYGDAMKLIHQYHINAMYGVPTMFQLFVNSADPAELAQFRYFVSGGAALPRVLYDEFAKKFGQHVQEGYGLSEASPVVTCCPTGGPRQSSIGVPIFNVEVQIQDEGGREVPAGEVGELCTRGPNVMLGYWNRPKETAYTLRGGWLHTEDLAYRDEDGYIYIVDRLKDMIISSGENVYPREVEEVLTAHPDIREAAVIGIPDKLRGQAICAYVVPEEGANLTKRMLRKYLLGKIAQYKVPREFILCNELPRNNTGKVLKKVLREKSIVDLIHRLK